MTHSRTVIVLLILMMALGVVDTRAEVHVNQLWDEHLGTFRVQVLDLGAGGITFDRSYQNAYGELNGLDPGPPFIIEAAIIASGQVDDDGEVVSFGSVTFESGGFGLMNPFRIIFQPSDINEGRMSINGPINFIGSPLDPIKVEGAFLIHAGHLGGTDPWGSGQHEMTWCNTEFSSPYVHQNTWNYNPIQFHGGNVTIRDCMFKGFSGFSDLISFYPSTLHTNSPVWDLTIDNCRFEDNSVSTDPLGFSFLKRVTFKNNYFLHNSFNEYSTRGLAAFDECGIGELVGNSAGTNDQNVIRWINAWVSDSAKIRTDNTLPLAATAILIPPDSALLVKGGSLLKFYHSGGFAVEGRLWIDSATLTSFNDDAFGGDSDVDGVQGYIYHWSPDTYGHTGGISVAQTGYANIRNATIRYAEGAVYARADVDVYDADIRYSDGFGIWLKSYGNEHFAIRKTSISHNTESGYGSDYPFMFDNAQGGSQRLLLDSVNIYDADMTGAVIRANSGQPNDIIISNCRFISNASYGLTVEMWPSLNSVEISNCSFVGNGDGGLYCPDFYGDDAEIVLENSLFVGNGFRGASHMGANIRAGIPLVVNNTFAYNNTLGLNFYETARDQVQTINNLFCHNGSYGYVLTDPGTSILSYNDFFGNNDGVQEVYYRLPTGTVKTIEEIQAAGGDYATNMHVDPQTKAEVIGTISAVRFDSAQFLSVIAADPNQFAGKSLRGTAICADSTEDNWYWVAMNTSDSLFVVGDVTDIAEVGDVFRIFDHHLLDISPLVEAGSNAAARGSYDLDGDPRIIDAEPDGTSLVDIGVDEYDPDGGYAAPIRVNSPIAKKVFMSEDTCTIKWQASGIDSVRVLFTSDPDVNPIFWDTAAACTTATTGRIDYLLPPLPVCECMVRVEDAADAATYDLSERFYAKPFELTYLDSQGKPVEFTVGQHAWAFGNFPEYMWPATWYNQINYETGIDTITGIAYPPYFTNAFFLNAKPEQFPDWQLWVHAFGVNECYVNIPAGLVYLPSALTRWADMKGEWQGSCFGLSVSTAMGFFDSTAFRAAYPAVDPYALLHDLPCDDDNRLVVNQLLLHQFGYPHRTYKNAHLRDTPRDLLAQSKELLGLNFTDGRVIGIGNSRRGGHAVNPYRLEHVYGNDGQYRLYVYDSNFPDTALNFVEQFILIDSANDTWEYADMPGWNDANGYCFLMDSAALYRTQPTLSTAVAGHPLMLKSPPEGTMEIYTPGATAVSIISTEGDTTGLHAGEVTCQIEGAEPMIPMGYATTPLGYSLAEADYRVEVGSDDQSTVAVSVWADSTVLRYSRDEVSPGEVDLLELDSGLTVENQENIAKPCQLTYLQMTSGLERQYVFSGLSMDSAGGYQLFAEDDSTVSLYNHGAHNICSVQLWYVTNGSVTIVTADHVTLPVTGRAVIIPDWTDPVLSNVLLARDLDGNGTLEDTTTLDLVTSFGDADDNLPLPTRYHLAQNYPNPFNASTNIAYTLPERGRVTIDIINVLGQKVRTLVDTDQPAGRYTAHWDGTDGQGNLVASGVYFYRITAGDFEASKKMIMLK